MGMTANGHGVSFWGDESVEKLDCGDDSTTLEFTKIGRIVHFKQMNFGGCK